ncbi:MAG: transporter substrate-binding domain-containing protein, partial [Puniceicoccales bacterium]|nr:transporter substrate-binding domain-containing protein [Puniceicoccales bacterium]
MELHQNDCDGLISGFQRNLYYEIVNHFSPEEEKESNVLFSSPYYACRLSLIVGMDINNIKSIFNCSGVVVGILRRSKAESVLMSSLRDIKVIGYPNKYCAISDLKDKRIDAIVLDGHVATYYVKKLSGLKIIDELDKV